jgi:exopolysaccharide biosynthesis WecB/TagA/CpsF family protein
VNRVVGAINMEDAVALIEHWIATRVPTFVCIAGVHGVIESLGHPRLRKIHDDAGIAQINAAKPDIVWVGLSTPKQEFWMAAHVGRLDAPVLIGVGAAFDFLAGIRKRAPRWMRRSGA